MDLDLADITPRKIITCTIEGIVDEDDLRLLASGASLQSEHLNGDSTMPRHEEVDDPASLKRVREKHHSVARLIATGMSESLVATISNYTPQYLSVLLNNPAMEELIATYRLQNGQQAQVIGEKLRSVGLRAVEKLEGKMDEMNASELTAVAKLGLDRSGHGPSSTQRNVNENHQIDHASLLALNRRAREDSKEFIIAVADVRQSLLPAPEVLGDPVADPDLAD